MTSFSNLYSLNKSYTGTGINHENQKFEGTICFSPIVSGKGILIHFKAVGENGIVFHEETSLLGEAQLKKSQYLVGNEFSSADIMLSQPLEWARKGTLLEKHPTIVQYLNTLKERSACKKSGIFG